LSWQQGFDPLEAGLRSKLRGFIETILEEDLSQVLARDRYARAGHEAHAVPVDYRHGHRTRELTTTLGKEEIAAPRAPFQ
jgi:transposase-like protein